MTRLGHSELENGVVDRIGAAPDPDDPAGFVARMGRVRVAASIAELKLALNGLKPLRGYRWVVINKEDLFEASRLTIGTKVGIMGPSGQVLKAADLPRDKSSLG
jgi:hypothetical protein